MSGLALRFFNFRTREFQYLFAGKMTNKRAQDFLPPGEKFQRLYQCYRDLRYAPDEAVTAVMAAYDRGAH